MRDYADAWKGIHFLMNLDFGCYRVFSPLISLVTKAEQTCSHYSLNMRENADTVELWWALKEQFNAKSKFLCILILLHACLFFNFETWKENFWIMYWLLVRHMNAGGHDSTINIVCYIKWIENQFKNESFRSHF